MHLKTAFGSDTGWHGPWTHSRFADITERCLRHPASPRLPPGALRSKLPKTSLRAVGRVLEVALSLERGEDVAVPGGVGIGHRGLHRRLGRGNNLELHGHALIRAAGTDD